MNFRSPLEGFTAKKLEENNIPFKYEEKSYELLPGFEYPSWEQHGKVLKLKSKVQPITYKPDFVGDNWVIEVKGFFRKENRLVWKLFKHKLLDENIMLFMPRRQNQVLQAIELIKQNEQNTGIFWEQSNVKLPIKNGRDTITTKRKARR